MNVLLNKDISKIHETLFWGLPQRETLLSGATIAIALVVRNVCYEYIIDDSLLAVVTALSAVPTGFLVLYKYQGMYGEQLIVEIIRSFFLKDMVLTGENELSDSVKQIAAERTKEGLKLDKIDKKEKRREKRKVSRTKKSAGHNPIQQDI